MNSVHKSICIIRSNPVCPDSRVEKEAASLQKRGFDVRILAWDRESNHKPTNDIVEVGDETIPITRLGYKASYGDGFKNIVSYLKFQFAMSKWLIKNRHSYDIIHACDFDTAFFSDRVARLFKKTFVFDVFDFICGSPQNLLQKMVKHEQLSIISRADGTIICTEERKKQISGSNPKKLVVIHNTPMEMLSVDSVQLNDSGKTKIVYVGILQDFRLLKEIGNYFASHSQVEFHIGGYGKYEQYFEELSLKHENIFYYGKLEYSKTLELERSCDLMLAIYDPTIENHIFAAPNKFYESLMLGKPVLMVRGTGMSEEIEKNDIGVLIDYSEEGFAKGVQELIDRKDEWEIMGERMQQLYHERYNWQTMEERLYNFYCDME